MSGFIQYDTAELQRGAAALSKASMDLNNHVKSMRYALSSMPHFRGTQADRFRANVEQIIRQVGQNAAKLDESTKALRKFAADAANMRI